MRWLPFVTVLFPLLTTEIDTQTRNNETVRNPAIVLPSLPTSDTVCNSAQRATESTLKQINYRDCLPLLNELLLGPNTNRQNQYDAATAHQALFHNTCSITLRSSSKTGSDVFWGYEIAVAAAMVVKHCIQDSADRYGGLEFITPKGLFYAVVRRHHEDGRAVSGMNTTTCSTNKTNALLLPSHIANTTFLPPHPSTAIPVCQITQLRAHHLHPVSLPDCYHLFYNLLTAAALERTVTPRGLSPIPYETYGSCTVQLRGNSALAADRFRFVEVLLAAVGVVQTLKRRFWGGDMKIEKAEREGWGRRNGSGDGGKVGGDGGGGDGGGGDGGGWGWGVDGDGE
ncbi:hypothetical protein BDR22DRAFT_824934 [Usnea florida]